MFVISSNGIIQMNRGDSCTFNIELNAGSTTNPDIVKLTNKYDSVYFGIIEPKKKFEGAIVRKTFNINDINEDGTIAVKLEPKDTQLLVPGIYYYEVKVELIDIRVRGKTTVYTVVPRTKFIIME